VFEILLALGLYIRSYYPSSLSIRKKKNVKNYSVFTKNEKNPFAPFIRKPIQRGDRNNILANLKKKMFIVFTILRGVDPRRLECCNNQKAKSVKSINVALEIFTCNLGTFPCASCSA
jgi:hypothetical protein